MTLDVLNPPFWPLYSLALFILLMWLSRFTSTRYRTHIRLIGFCFLFTPALSVALLDNASSMKGGVAVFPAIMYLKVGFEGVPYAAMYIITLISFMYMIRFILSFFFQVFIHKTNNLKK